MNRAEKYSNIVDSQKTTLSNWIYYFYMLHRFKKSAHEGYSGTNWYSPLNPWIRNRFEKKCGFKVTTDCTDKNSNKYTEILWKVNNDT